MARSRSEEETIAAGAALARDLSPGATVLLIGQLGAGKTTLAKGIVEGLGGGPAADVCSPTYTLIHEYGDPVVVYHVDLYRIETLREAASLGLEELFDSGAVVLIEWGERFPELLPRRRVEVRLQRCGEAERDIQVLLL